MTGILPTITTLSPVAGWLIGGAGFTFTVNGTGFVANSQVIWNSISLVTKLISSTQLTAAVPAGTISTPGVANITVSNAPGAVSNAVVYPDILPTITTLAPAAWLIDGPAYTLTVNGTGFVPNSQVEWNGSPLFTKFVSATQVLASVAATLISSPAPVNIAVLNAVGASFEWNHLSGSGAERCPGSIPRRRSPRKRFQTVYHRNELRSRFSSRVERSAAGDYIHHHNQPVCHCHGGADRHLGDRRRHGCESGRDRLGKNQLRRQQPDTCRASGRSGSHLQQHCRHSAGQLGFRLRQRSGQRRLPMERRLPDSAGRNLGGRQWQARLLVVREFQGKSTCRRRTILRPGL